MKRWPIVVGATVAGLAGVLSFHTSATPLSLGAQPKLATRSSGGAVASGPPPRPSTSGSTGGGSRSTAPTTRASTTTRTATGPQVNYTYGILSVSVTVTGSRLTKVTIASLDDGGSFRSETIDQQAVPLLEQQALAAQSADIQGVSGASYTSAGFAQSLQAALARLHFA